MLLSECCSCDRPATRWLNKRAFCNNCKPEEAQVSRYKDEQPKTFASRHGFHDSDLTSPKHDAIMLWLHENIGDVLGELASRRYPAADGTVESVIVDWEVPVQVGRNDFTVGFIDMVARGSARLKEPEDNQTHYGIQAVIEVKTSIPSVGELLRQINHIRTNARYYEPVYVVVCPDARFKEIIESQGYYFVKVPPEVVG